MERIFSDMQTHRLTICWLFVISILSCGEKNSTLEIEQDQKTSPASDFDYKTFIGNDFHIDDQHSYVGFKIKYFGFSPVRGRFNDFDGTIFYDSTDHSKISATVHVDASSINTGNERRDNDLKTEGSWFDVHTFPHITYRSIETVPRGGGAFDLIGFLTIKGVTKIDTIVFDRPTGISKDWAGNDQVDFSGRMTINRQDFNVVGGDFWSSVLENGLTQLADEVEIELDIHARRFDYAARYLDADSTDVVKQVVDRVRDMGIGKGLDLIDKLFNDGLLTSGRMSSIGYTLNRWQFNEEAMRVFQRKLDYFPDASTTWNQLGITNLITGNVEESRQNFAEMLTLDSMDSRAIEYHRLIEKLSTTKR